MPDAAIMTGFLGELLGGNEGTIKGAGGLLVPQGSGDGDVEPQLADVMDPAETVLGIGGSKGFGTDTGPSKVGGGDPVLLFPVMGAIGGHNPSLAEDLSLSLGRA